MCNRNFRVLVNFPKQVPREIRFSRATFEACFIIFSVFMEPKAVCAVLSVYQKLYVVSDVFAQLLKEYLCFLFCKRPHFFSCRSESSNIS